jgi:hypothetical protein
MSKRVLSPASVLTDVVCDFADDVVTARDGFCSACGRTDHQVIGAPQTVPAIVHATY